MTKMTILQSMLFRVQIPVSIFNPLQLGVAFLYPPENFRKPLGLLMFLGGVEKSGRAVMG